MDRCRPLFTASIELKVVPVPYDNQNRALTHGVMSFNGQMCWRLLGERAAAYNISAYADFFDASLAELLGLAGQKA